MAIVRGLFLVTLLVSLAFVTVSAEEYVGGYNDKIVDTVKDVQEGAQEALELPTSAPTGVEPPRPNVDPDRSRVVTADTVTRDGGVIEVGYVGVVNPTKPAPFKSILPPVPIKMVPPVLEPPALTGGYGGAIAGDTQRTVNLWTYPNGTDALFPIRVPKPPTTRATAVAPTQDITRVNGPVGNTGSRLSLFGGAQSTPTGGLEALFGVGGSSVGPLLPVDQTRWLAAMNNTNNTDTPPIPFATTPVSGFDETYNGAEYGAPIPLRKVDIDGHCVAWGHPASLATFDDAHYTFSGMGEFVMYAATDNSEQVNLLQERDGRLSFVTGVAFRTGIDVLTVNLEKNDQAQTSVVVRINGKLVPKQATPEETAGFSILQEGMLNSARRLTLAIRNGNNTKLAIAFYDRSNRYHADVFLQVDGSLWGRTKGLCGTYNFNEKDDMVTADGQVVELSAQLATSWAVQHPNSYWQNYLPNKDVFVSSDLINSFQLSQSESDFQNARMLCGKKFGVPKEWAEICRLNVLQGGQKMGREEVTDIIAISTDGNVKVDKPECLNEQFKLGPWSDFGNCSSLCAQGVRKRARHIYTAAQGVCGILTQSVNCKGSCGHIDVTGRCAAYGVGHVSTFDQSLFSFHGTGEYVMYHDPNAREAVHILLNRPRANVSAAVVVGAAFRFGEDIYSVQLRAPEFTEYQAGWNKQEGLAKVTTTGSQGTTGHTITVTTLGRGATVVEIMFSKTNGVAHFNVLIKLKGQHISTENVGFTQGLCGVWDFDRSNDFMDAKGRIGRDAAASSYSYRVLPVNSFFLGDVPQIDSPPDVQVSSEDLHPTVQMRLGAREECRKVMRAKLKPFCKFDFYFFGTGPANDGVWARKKIGSTETRVTGHAAACLRKPGTQAGPFSNYTTECSRTCGGGYRFKFRKIVDVDGDLCGDLIVGRPCNERPCPVDCQAAPWGEWSACSNVCGNGTRTRTRTVDVNPAFGGTLCPHLNETEACSESFGCCNMGNWSTWGPCHNGQHSRDRDVNFPTCGHNKETRPCCEMSAWSEWSDCVGGKSKRNRFLSGDEHVCENFEKEQTRDCCSTTEWTDWGPCYGGVRMRERNVTGACGQYATNETQECCTVYDWSRWSDCEAGLQVRNRVLTGACTRYNNTEKRQCCFEGAWKDWSRCENGQQIRFREVLGTDEACKGVAFRQNKSCCIIHPWTEWSTCVNGTRSQTRKLEGDDVVCGRHRSERHRPCCQVGEWSGWGQCQRGIETRVRYVTGDYTLCSRTPPTEQRACCRPSVWGSWSSCTDGFQSRNRTLKGNLTACAHMTNHQNRTCCMKGPWSPWSACENGVVNRHRTLTGPPELCDHHKKEESKPCCHVHDWSDWGECYNGQFNRSRVLSGDKEFCTHWRAIEHKPCCEVSAWSDWGVCHANVQSKYRKVVGSPQHCDTIDTNASQQCCETGPWSGWTECKEGSQTRQRFVGALPACTNVKPREVQPCCTVGPWDDFSPCLNNTQWRQRAVVGHDGCEGEYNSIEYRMCGELKCTPGPWSEWSVCRGDRRHRERVVFGPSTCTVTVPLVEREHCAFNSSHPVIEPCTVSEWSDWTTCNGGKQERHRILMGNCSGNFKPVENLACQHCMVGPWEKWTQCWNRTRIRTRVVDGTCPTNYSTVEHQPCFDPCHITKWSKWSSCADSGSQERTRNVTGDCADVEPISIDSRTCCVIGPWSAWSACGPEGEKTRTRHVMGDKTCQAAANSTTVDKQQCCEASRWSEWSYDKPGYRIRNRSVTHAEWCTHLRTSDIEEFCHVGAWQNWGECEAGYRTRKRWVDSGSNCLAKYVPEQRQPCCVVGEWSEWSECSGLPLAQRLRTRSVTDSAECLKLFNNNETKQCEPSELAFCKIGEYGPWRDCQPDGTQTRMRTVSNPSCQPYLSVTDTQKCCIMGAWSDWSDCQDGHEVRRRNLTATSFCTSQFANAERRDCECSVGTWSDWSECNPVLATQTRHRDVYGNSECRHHHPRVESRSCCEATEFTEWTECNAHTGKQHRNRSVHPEVEACKHEFPTHEERPCCHVGEWSGWSDCEMHGDEYQHSRTRHVTGDESCEITYKSMEWDTCCKVGQWSLWGRCHNGQRKRSRLTAGPTEKCEEVEKKQFHPCCSAEKYGEWSACDRTGHRTRSRVVHGPRRCAFKFPEEQTGECCYIGKWSEWSDGHCAADHDGEKSHGADQEEQHDAEEEHHDAKEEHHDAKEEHHDAKEEHHDAKEEHHDAKEEHHDAKEEHHAAEEEHHDAKEEHHAAEEEHHDAKEEHHAAFLQQRETPHHTGAGAEWKRVREREVFGDAACVRGNPRVQRSHCKSHEEEPLPRYEHNKPEPPNNPESDDDHPDPRHPVNPPPGHHGAHHEEHHDAHHEEHHDAHHEEHHDAHHEEHHDAHHEEHHDAHQEHHDAQPQPHGGVVIDLPITGHTVEPVFTNTPSFANLIQLAAAEDAVANE